MSIMSQLEFQLEFSQSEKILSQYILENGEQVLNLNAKELAKYTYTSPATVVRLCQKLGLKGYSDFKIKYSAELKSESNVNNRINVNFPFNKGDNMGVICDNMQRLYKEVIEDTISLLNINDIDKVIDILFKSEVIYVFGAGNNMFSALDFENKMSRIGARISIRLVEGEQIISAYNATENDVAIFITYSGETENIVNLAEMVKRKNTPIIAITSVGKNLISRYADYVLNTSSRENVYNKIATFSSKISTDFILDIIFSGYFNKNYDKHLDNRIGPSKLFDKRKLQSPIAD